MQKIKLIDLLVKLSDQDLDLPRKIKYNTKTYILEYNPTTHKKYYVEEKNIELLLESIKSVNCLKDDVIILDEIEKLPNIFDNKQKILANKINEIIDCLNNEKITETVTTIFNNMNIESEMI